jgi:hypothetical protein
MPTRPSGALRAPQADAAALAAVLGDPETGGFTVETLVNRPYHEVRRRLSKWLRQDAAREDTLLCYVSGHGIKDESGQLHLVTTDTERDAVDVTALAAADLRRMIDLSPARRTALWLDCCYSGAFPAGRTAKADDTVDVVAQPSVFTDASELYRYVYDEVRRSTPDQTPTRNDQVVRDLYTTQSNRGLPVDPSLPLEIRQSLRSATPRIRKAAIDELADLAAAGDATARNTLALLSSHADTALAQLALAAITPTAEHPVADPGAHVSNEARALSQPEPRRAPIPVPTRPVAGIRPLTLPEGTRARVRAESVW